MKKIILLSLALACQNLYAVPASKPVATVKAVQSGGKISTKKVATEKKSEKIKPVDKKNAKAEGGKGTKAEAKKTTAPQMARKVKADVSHVGKAAGKTAVLAKADKQHPKEREGVEPRKAAETKKIVAQKAENHRDKSVAKSKADKKTAATGKKAPALFKKHETAAASGKGNPRSTLLNHGKKFIGTPYVWGGASPKGFDCSGLVHYLYQKQGVSIPRNSREQFSRLPVASNPQPGDLVFFRRNGVINHVGLYLGGGKMLHAPQTGSKVRIEDMGRPNWKRRYAGARRALKGEKTVIIASQSKKNAVVRDKRVAKRAQTNKEKAKVAAVLKKSKVVTARR